MRVVFVHGFLGSALNWGPVITRLNQSSWAQENGARLEAYDLLGHGFKSQKTAGKLNVEDLGIDLLEDIQKNSRTEGEKIIVVGHSFGVRPLLWICSKYPNLFSGFVVEDSSPVVSEQGFQELSAIFDQICPPFKTRTEAKDAIETVFGLNTKMSRFLLTGIRENTSGNFDWRFNAESLKSLLRSAYENPQWNEWESYPGPVAMIMGADSKFVSPERQSECLARRQVGKTQIVQINQSGHWVHSDQPIQFCDELVKIFKEWLASQKF
jgi:esterase